MRWIIVCAGILSTQPASAFCFQGVGHDFASSVNSALDHLICLHNEQVKSINEHADIINDQSARISQMQSEIEILQAELSILHSALSRVERD